MDLTNVRLALVAIKELIGQLRKFKPHAVYLLISQNALGYLRDGLLIWCVKTFSRAAVVVHLHGGYFRTFYGRSGRVMRWFIDQTLSRADLGVVLGKSLTHHLEPWIGRIRVVPNGTDIGLQVDIRDKLSKERKAVTVTYFSSLRRSKGIFTFLEAAALVARDHPSVTFEIAGNWAPDPLDGADPDTSRNLADEMVQRSGLDGRVRFRGLLVGEAKAQFLLETDIFVLPSFYPYEGQPIAIIEAMAFGCPVVSTAQGVIPELVIDGQTGFIVPAQDPNSLAERISTLVADWNGRRRMAVAARARYEQLHTTAHCVQQLAAVFGEATRVKESQRGSA